MITMTTVILMLIVEVVMGIYITRTVINDVLKALDPVEDKLERKFLYTGLIVLGVCGIAITILVPLAVVVGVH